MGGLGYRKGYDKGKSHGVYVRLPTSEDKDYKPLEKKMIHLIIALEGVGKDSLPSELKERERVIKWYCLDSVTKVLICFTFL